VWTPQRLYCGGYYCGGVLTFLDTGVYNFFCRGDIIEKEKEEAKKGFYSQVVKLRNSCLFFEKINGKSRTTESIPMDNLYAH